MDIRRHSLFVIAVTAVLATACGRSVSKNEPDGGTDTDTATDTGTGADGGTDAGGIIIAGGEGEQSVPHVALTSDDRLWVSYYSTATGSYVERLQLLDPSGAKLLGGDGLLVSDNAQDTWVMDTALATADDDAAILAFGDIRTGQEEVYAYKIATDGTFEWGADGLALEAGGDPNAWPSVVIASDGDAVFSFESWPDDESVKDSSVLQRVTPDGMLLWGDGVVLANPAMDVIRPRLAAADNGAVIVVWIETPDLMSDERVIRARKIAPSGEPVWTDDRTVISGQPIPMYIEPILEPDGAGGVFVAFTQVDPGEMLHAYVQHLDANGTSTMPAGGVALSTDESREWTDPCPAWIASANELVVSWREMDASQGSNGLAVQRFTPDGARGWGGEGVRLVDLSPDWLGSSATRGSGSGAAIFYGTAPAADFTAISLFAGRVSLDDETPVWTPDALSPVGTSKSRVEVSARTSTGFWLVWSDSSNDTGDIYGLFEAM